MVVAMDLNPENVDAVKNGDLLFDIGGHWLQGGFALVMLYDEIKGKPVPKDQDNVKLKLLPLTQGQASRSSRRTSRAACRPTTSRRTPGSTPRTRAPASFELKYSK